MKLDLKICLVYLIAFYCFSFSSNIAGYELHAQKEDIKSATTLTYPTVEIYWIGFNSLDTLTEYISPSEAVNGFWVVAKVNDGTADGISDIESVVLNWKVNSQSANTFMLAMPLLYNMQVNEWHYCKRMEGYSNGTKIFWWVTAQNVDGEMASTEVDSFLIGTLNVDNDLMPSKFKILGNYPNPFNPATKINFSVNQPSDINMSIFSLSGQIIRQFNLGVTQPGNKSITWNGKDMIGNDVPSGVYMYKIQSGEHSQFKKMTLLK